jgi:hypothetical protein
LEFFRGERFAAWNSSGVKCFELGILHGVKGFELVIWNSSRVKGFSLEFFRGITMKNMYP